MRAAYAMSRLLVKCGGLEDLCNHRLGHQVVAHFVPMETVSTCEGEMTHHQAVKIINGNALGLDDFAALCVAFGNELIQLIECSRLALLRDWRSRRPDQVCVRCSG